MKLELTPQQREDRAAYRDFVEREIAPYADAYDREESIPSSLVGKLAARGFLGLAVPQEWGGGGRDMITYGLLHGEIGRGCSSVRSLLTVHGMVTRAIIRWGLPEQKKRWLPKLASGEVIGAFGLTETKAGSDAASVQTTAMAHGESYRLNGVKRWITFGQIADLFLIFARCEGRPAAFLVERDSPGLSVTPIKGMLGVRASMLAEVRMEDCRIPSENLVGRVGFGVSHVASHALDEGRYSVAWGCVGIAEACQSACLRYTAEREQFGAPLKDHQLIRRMLTEMITNTRAAKLLCYQAGYHKDTGDPGAMLSTLIAKYFASVSAARAANDAVQIHGANGCSDQYPVQRYMRDAKIMEIIEGSTQIQQITIPEHNHADF
jgi:alkylation response protein AidB-like acyl-CoA dehydrogenase